MQSRPADESPLTARGLVEAVTAVTASGDRTTALQTVVDQACRVTGVTFGALLVVDSHGRPTEMFQHGQEVDPSALTGLVGTPITVGGHTLALLYLGDHDDGTALGPHESAVVRTLVGVAGYVLEHARSRAVAERRRVWQNHAAALAGTLQPPFDFSAADRAVTDVAMGAAGADGSSIARLVDGEVVVTATSGRAPTWVGGEEHDAAVHAVLDGTSGETGAGQDHVVLLAAISTHLTPAGALAVYFPAERPPADYENDLLTEFAEQAALALDRARAFQEREQMALVSDRDRIARDLHDVVIQRLFATGLHLQKSRAMATDPELRERLALSMQDLDQTIRAIRGSIFDLRGRPSSSVRSELRDVVTEYADQLGFVPAVRTQGPIDEALSRPVQQALVEVLRQALSNIARHAGASTATVELHVTDDALLVEVSDDGHGLDPDHREGSLASLRLALDLRGGTLDVRESDDGGTVLSCRIPLR